MSKLKNSFKDAFIKAQTMSTEEKNTTVLMQKILLKKLSLPLIGLLVLTILAIALKLNIWGVLAFECIAGISLFKYTKKEVSKLNDFQYYMGNLLSIEDKGEYSTILLKQGKLPVKLNIKYGKDSFAKIKKNQFIKIAYNKESALATIVN